MKKVLILFLSLALVHPPTPALATVNLQSLLPGSEASQTGDELVVELSKSENTETEYQITYSNSSESGSDRDLIVVMKNKRMVSFKYCVAVKDNQETEVATYRQKFLMDPETYQKQPKINEIGNKLFNSPYCEFIGQHKAYVLMKPDEKFQGEQVERPSVNTEWADDNWGWATIGGFVTGFATLFFFLNDAVEFAPKTLSAFKRGAYFVGHNKTLVLILLAMGISVTGGPGLNINRVKAFLSSRGQEKDNKIANDLRQAQAAIVQSFNGSELSMEDLKENIEDGIKLALEYRFLVSI